MYHFNLKFNQFHAIISLILAFDLIGCIETNNAIEAVAEASTEAGAEAGAEAGTEAGTKASAEAGIDYWCEAVCGGELIWGGDHDLDKDDSLEYYIVSNLTCSSCESFVEVYHKRSEDESE